MPKDVPHVFCRHRSKVATMVLWLHIDSHGAIVLANATEENCVLPCWQTVGAILRQINANMCGTHSRFCLLGRHGITFNSRQLLYFQRENFIAEVAGCTV